MTLRRLVILLGVVGLVGGSAAVLTLFVAGSGVQLERHLEREWSVGDARFESPQMTDLDTVRFRTFHLRSAPLLAESDFLVLRDLDWGRPRLVPEPGSGDIREARVHFDEGMVQLEYQDDVGWNFGQIAAADWWNRLPTQVEGPRLDLRLRRISAIRAVTLDLEVGPVEMSRAVPPDGPSGAAEGLWLWARIRGKDLGQGELRAHLGPAPTLVVELDEVPLSRFPFADLVGLIEFPWPARLQLEDGLGDIDWNWGPERHEVGIDHYLATVRGSGIPQPLRYLEGHVDVSRDRLEWQLTQGVYSRSPLSGQLEIRGGREVEGRFTIRDWLGDAGLADGLPEVWTQLARELSPVGESSLTIDLAGPLGRPLWTLVQRLEAKLVAAGLGRRADGTGLHATITIDRSGAEPGVVVVNETSRLAGWVFPPGRWEGSVTDDGFEIERRDVEGPRMHFELEAKDDGTVEFKLDASGVDLGSLIDRSIGSAHATLSIEGSWRQRRGIRWEGWVSWSGLTVGGLPWPAHAPRNEVNGLVGLRHERGRTTVQLLASDRHDLWVARGDISTGNEWRLEGAVLPQVPGLLPADAVPRILDRPSVAGEVRFEVVGPLLRWSTIED